MKNIKLNAKILAVLTVIAYGIAFLMGWNKSVLSSAFALLGLILLLMTVVTFIRELLAKRRAAKVGTTQTNQG